MMKPAVQILLFAALAFAVPAFAQYSNTDNQNDNDGSANKAQQQDADRHANETGGQTDEDVQRRLTDATADLNRLTSSGDNNIPQSILADAKCVAIVPKLLKGGFVFGAQHGRGVATCRLQNKRWSAPAFFTITGGSWGAQIGVEGVDLVMLFMNQEGAEKLLNAEWKIGADAGIAAGPWGRDASVNTDWKANSGILTYSHAKGVFAGATLNGANVRADEDSIRRCYGQSYNFRQLLTGQVTPPAGARQFLADVRRDFHEAQAEK